MFDFQKLNVFEKAVDFTAAARKLAEDDNGDGLLTGQLVANAQKAALGIAYATSQINIDKRRNFFEEARGSVYKCAGIVVMLNEDQSIEEEQHNDLLEELTGLSKMLYSLAKKTTPKAVPSTNAVEAD